MLRSVVIYVSGTFFSEMAGPIRIKLGGCIQFTLSYGLHNLSTSGPEVKPEVGFPAHENDDISAPKFSSKYIIPIWYLCFLKLFRFYYEFY